MKNSSVRVVVGRVKIHSSSYIDDSASYERQAYREPARHSIEDVSYIKGTMICNTMDG